MGGLKKFFDGYDWQPIVLIDDPVEPNTTFGSEDIQMFETIINEHPHMIEIKGAALPFDTGLVIITANLTPMEMATACGLTCKDAIYRCLTSKPGASEVLEHEREKLTKFINC